jgi:hypothetical protein
MMTTDETKKLNRLRAAASLLPQIEAGLADGKISREKAALSAEFCTWAVTEADPGCQEGEDLARKIGDGLERLRERLRA